MRVNIGPYPKWYSVTSVEHWWYQWRYKKYDWDVDDEEKDRLDRAFDAVMNWWQRVLSVTVNRLWQERRVEVKIHHYDTWSMDHTLALIILPMLKQLKETKHGYPLSDPKDAPTIGKGEEIDQGMNDDKAEERWDWILDEMIWAFEQVIDELEGSKNYYVSYKPNEQVKRLRTVNVNGEEHYFETEEQARARGKFDVKLYKKYNARVNNGFRLFGKYYRSLWD